MDTPNLPTPPLLLSTLQRFGVGSGMRSLLTGGNLVTTAWGTANLAIFVPMRIPYYMPIRAMFWYNFATVAGNVEAAIFTTEYVKLWTTGSVAQAGATQQQYAALTSDAWLIPGEYRFMLASSSTTATFACVGSGTTAKNRAIGITQFGAASLPVGAVTAANAGQARVPMIGASQLATSPW